VSNIDNAVHFFRDLLGLGATPIREVDNDGVRTIIGMPGANLRTSLVKVPGRVNIELIEYVHPRGRSLDLKTCNAGVGHVAFRVEDIQRMYEDFISKGVRFVNPPVWLESNDGTGNWGVCYIKGPDGITIELIEVKSRGG